MEQVCKHYQTGYCKFGEHCRKHHVNIICKKENCNSKDCIERHPKICKYFTVGNACKFDDSCSYLHVKRNENSDISEQNTLKEKVQEMEKKMEEAALKVEHNELKEKVKLLEAVVQNMFQNLIRLDREVGELRTINKSKDITEKASTKRLSIKEVTIPEKEYQSKEETISKEVDIIKKVNNPKLSNFKEDKLNDHFKCDNCDYSCKKSNVMKKHMNTKHCTDHLEKDHNSDKKENMSNEKIDKITGKDKTIKNA